jgi:hypothetical protein
MSTGGLVASNNFSKTSFIREVVHGVTPATPAWQEIPVVSNSLKLSPSRGRSKDIRADGQAGGSFLLDLSNAGALAIELKFKHWDSFFESALRNRWVNKAVRDNNGVADSVITDVNATGGVVTCTTGTAFAANHICLASGFGLAANNGIFNCTTGSATVPAFNSQGLLSEPVPPAAARIRAIGFIAPSAADITAVAAGLASTVADFTTFGIVVGEWHWIGGTAAGNKFATAPRGWARVGAIAAHLLTYDILPTGWVVDAGVGKTLQVFFGDFLPNGTTSPFFDSYSFEGQQRDLAAVNYEYFTGDFLNNATISLAGGKEIDASFDWLGMGGTAMSTTRFAGSTDVAALTYGTLTASANVGDLIEGGVSLLTGANCMSGASIKIANNVTRDVVVGPLGSAAIIFGAFTVNGNVDTYLGDATILAKGPNDTLSSFSTMIGYSSGNREAYRVDMPAIRLTPESGISGANQARKVSGPFEAEPHATLGYTISLGRFAYLPA